MRKPSAKSFAKKRIGRIGAIAVLPLPLLLPMILLLLLCSCSPAAKEAPVPPPAFLVGTTGAASGTFYENRLRVVEAADGQMVKVELGSDSFSAANIAKSIIEAGCDGFTIMPVNEAVLPQIVEMCEEAGVYWAIFMRPLHDEEVRQIVESSPFFAGRVQENDEDAAYEIVRQLGLDGKKEIALIMPRITDPVGEARARGLYRAADEFGVKVVAEVNNASTAEDIHNVVSDIIVAHPGLDAVFRVGSTVRNCTRAAIRAIEASGRAITFAAIDLDDITEDDFDNGIVAVAAGGHKELDHVLSTGILANAINGTPLSPDGPASVTINYLMVRSAQDLRKYNEACARNGGVLFSQDSARRMLLKKYNDALTLADYESIASSYTLDNLDVLKIWNP